MSSNFTVYFLGAIFVCVECRVKLGVVSVARQRGVARGAGTQRLKLSASRHAIASASPAATRAALASCTGKALHYYRTHSLPTPNKKSTFQAASDFSVTCYLQVVG